MQGLLSSYARSLCGSKGLLSLGGTLDCLLRQRQTFLSPTSTHFLPSASQCEPPEGHIMSRACDKEPGSGGGGWRGRPSDWPGRLQLESSSVSPFCLFLCTYGGCRPVLSQRVLWKGRNVMLLLRYTLWWSLSVVARLYLLSMKPTLPQTPQSPSVFPEQKDYRRQARCNCSLRYAGWMLWPLPRASSAPETEWRGHQNRLLYLREGSSKRGSPSFSHSYVRPKQIPRVTCIFLS